MCDPLTLRCPCRSDWTLSGSLPGPGFLFGKSRATCSQTWIECARRQRKNFRPLGSGALTVAGGVQGLERAAPEPQPRDAVSLAVQDLQTRKQRGVQLAQAIVPHVQLGHVTQEVRLVRHHAADPVQSERRERTFSGWHTENVLKRQCAARL